MLVSHQSNNMKGTIHYCLEEAIKEKFGEEEWMQCLEHCGYPEDHSYMMKIRDDIDEKESIDLFVKCSEALNIPLGNLFDVFGEYWCVEYAPSLYGAFFIGINSSKEAITKLDWVHDRVTKHIENSKPPRFVYDWLDENKLQLTYKSSRGLIDLFISLVKGLNAKFGDHCAITKLSDSQLIIDFNPRITETTFVDKTKVNVD